MEWYASKSVSMSAPPKISHGFQKTKATTTTNTGDSISHECKLFYFSNTGSTCDSWSLREAVVRGRVNAQSWVSYTYGLYVVLCTNTPTGIESDSCWLTLRCGDLLLHRYCILSKSLVLCCCRSWCALLKLGAVRAVHGNAWDSFLSSCLMRFFNASQDSCAYSKV